MGRPTLALALALAGLALAGVALTLNSVSKAEARPSALDCSTATSWAVGYSPPSFTSSMGIASFTAPGSSSACAVTLPASYTPCQQYSITVDPGPSATQALKLYASGGSLQSAGSVVASGQCGDVDTPTSTATSFTWTAPSDGSTVTFSALCGRRSTGVVMFRAAGTVALTSGLSSSCAAVGGGGGNATSGNATPGSATFSPTATKSPTSPGSRPGFPLPALVAALVLGAVMVLRP